MNKIVKIIVATCLLCGGSCGNDNHLRLPSIGVGDILSLTGVGSVAGSYVCDSLNFTAQKAAVFGMPKIQLRIEDSKSALKDAILACILNT